MSDDAPEAAEPQEKGLDVELVELEHLIRDLILEVKASYTPSLAVELAMLASADVSAEHSETTFSRGYEQAADALWKAALAAFNLISRQLGVTGFQASWAALRLYGQIMHVEGPYGVYKLEDVLYPQSDPRVRLQKFVEENLPWLQERAAAKLSEHGGDTFGWTVHPDVRSRWLALARGEVPPA